jgi:putative hydrolase of HD superfamily
MDRERFERQIAFLKEIDKVKGILRRSRLLDDSRYENDAEHGWHVAVMAMVLAEYANAGGALDVSKVVRMLLIHDIVEIDAGDTLVYDQSGREQAKEKERQAAARIFGLLPEDQRGVFEGLWLEFEARQTPEAKFAAALDRLEPILQNACTGGHAWRKHGISLRRAEAANQHIAEGSEDVWEYVLGVFAECEKKGYFGEGRGGH